MTKEVYYLAYIPMPMGSGAYAGGTDKEAAIKSAAYFAANDFSHLWKTDGAEVTVGIFDQTDHEEVRMEDGCVYYLDGDKKKVYLDPLEQRKITLETEK